MGDDGGTFAAALASVRAFGGVLEHPAFSKAWAAHQAAYGHRAPKATWLYYVGAQKPAALDWSRPPTTMTTTTSRRRKAGVEMTSHRERAATPPAFRDVLLALARGAR